MQSNEDPEKPNGLLKKLKIKDTSEKDVNLNVVMIPVICM